MSYPLIELPISYIEEFRRCVDNNDHLILNNKPYRQTWNILCACMGRIEDTARYLNSKLLGEKHDYGCAFDLMEFLSHSASMLDCIDTIIETLKAEDKIKNSAIIFKGKEITNQGKLDERLSRIRDKKPYKNEDDLYFEYIRSIGVVHPNNTNHHPYFQQYKKEVSPFLIWNGLVGLTGGDISLHVYDSDGEDDGIHSLKLQLAEIYAYIINRYNRIPVLKDVFCSQINSLTTKLKTQKILSENNFDDYGKYLLYLKTEAHKRNEYTEYCVDETMKMIGLNGIPKAINEKYLKYCNALKYAMNSLRHILQAPIFDDDFNEDILAQELHLPSLLREDESNGVGYCYEKTSKLYDSDRYGKDDIDWARTQAKNLYKIVKEYALIDDDALDKLGNLQLLATLNTALYFYSLNHDTFINKKIPKTNTYR